MILLTYYLQGLVLCSGIMGLSFLLYLKTRNISVIILFWPLGLLGLGAYHALNIGIRSPLQLLLLLLLSLWAFRLFIFLLFTRITQKYCDNRYDEITKNGDTPRRFSFFLTVQQQAFFQSIVGIPLLLLPYYLPSPRLFFISSSLCVFAIIGEGIADLQLYRFVRHQEQKSTDPQKKPVCRTGLWAYSRHPNLFFEWLFWLSLSFSSLGTPFFSLSLMGPLVLLWLMLKVTIPITERQSLTSRPEHLRYQKEVSRFCPWPPKESNYTVSPQ